MAEQPNGGIFVVGDVTINALGRQTIAAVARHRLPAIYSERHFAASGGLIYYGADRIDLFRRAASYVDRILRGEKPGDLPYQQPTKYDLVINLKTVKALGLTIPPNFCLPPTRSSSSSSFCTPILLRALTVESGTELPC